jgi:integrase
MKLIRRKGKGDLPGSIYRPKYRDKDGNLIESMVYWVKYYKDGKPYRESTKKSEYEDARSFLLNRVKEVDEGKTPNIGLNKVKYDDLEKLIRGDYQDRGLKSTVTLNIRLESLKEYFGGVLVVKINSAKVRGYKDSRLADGVSNSTINRELSALRRMLVLGTRQTPPLVDRVLWWQELEEPAPREGFLEPDEFVAFRNHLPEYLKGYATFAYRTGWRSGETKGLTWDKVDLKRGTVSLRFGETKNKDNRLIALDSELKSVLAQAWAGRGTSDYVFTNKAKDGKLGDCRKAWDTAARKAGFDDLIPHDFRRSAVRNLVRSGLHRTVAKKVTGHKSDGVFERYNITDERDMFLAAKTQEEYLKAKEAVSNAPDVTLETAPATASTPARPVTGKVTGKVIEFRSRPKHAK